MRELDLSWYYITNGAHDYVDKVKKDGWDTSQKENGMVMKSYYYRWLNLINVKLNFLYIKRKLKLQFK